MHLHFLSGLPRAGTTLLASILRQNPKITASLESPVGQIVTDAVTSMGERNEARLFLDNLQRAAIIRSIMSTYYIGAPPWRIDNNRRWTANLDLIAQCWHDSKVIALVRPMHEIVDSFERLFRAGALMPSIIHGGTANRTVYDRFDTLVGGDGVIGFAWKALRDAFYGPHSDKLIIIEYADLAQRPQEVMEFLTAQLGLPAWNYDFEDIVQIPKAEEFDQQLLTPGLHALLPTVRYDNRPFVIPPDVIARCAPPFWRVKKTETSAP